MSLILDALNRADKERNEQQLTPSLQALPVSPEKAAGPLWGWLIAVLIAVGAAVAGFYMLTAQTDRDTGKVVAVRAQPKADTSPDRHESPLPAPTLSVAPEAPPAAPVKPAPKAASPQPNGHREATLSKQTDTIAKLYQKKPAVAKLADSTDRKPRAKTTASEKPADKSGEDILRQIPYLSAMPPGFQQQIPNIEYSVHVYNAEKGRGVVKLNGKICRIGSLLGPGLRVIAILPESVVLEYQGTEFRLHALNSWMNFH